MKLATYISFILPLVLVLAACNQVEFRKTKAGIPYKIFSSKGKADSVHVNYIVKYHVIQKVKDSVMTNTYRDDKPIYEQVQEINRPLTYTDIRGNVMEVLPQLKKGDSLYLVQSTDSIINANPGPTPFKKGEEIVTTIRIVDVYKTPDEANSAYQKENEPKIKEAIANAEKQEKTNLEQFRNDTAVKRQMAIDNKLIEDYLTSHHIQAQKTDWGVYIQVKDPGQGEKPTIGKYVNVRYSGKHMNGEVFDSGVFPLQIGTGAVVKGFEEGIKQLGTGGKATVYIPSMLAYGANGRDPKVKPNEVLIFDLELLQVSDKPIQPAPQPVDTSATRR